MKGVDAADCATSAKGGALIGTKTTQGDSDADGGGDFDGANDSSRIPDNVVNLGEDDEWTIVIMHDLDSGGENDINVSGGREPTD